MDSLNKKKFIEHKRAEEYDTHVKKGIKKFAFWPRFVYTPTERHFVWFKSYYVLYDLIMYDPRDGEEVTSYSDYIYAYRFDFHARERYLSLEDLTALILKGDTDNANPEGAYFRCKNNIMSELSDAKKREVFVKYGSQKHKVESSQRVSRILSVDTRW